MPCLASDQGTEAACLNHYQQLINNTEGIDICLLGMGEDGHTASLFENNLASNLANPEQVISINNADKYPPQRHSFNYSLIKQCRQVFLLACGATKSKALTEAYISPGKSSLPIAQLIEHQQALNNITILADREACKDLSGFIRLENETMN